jgi:long-subunit acyl-CoA synthetase (AMP-forming)
LIKEPCAGYWQRPEETKRTFVDGWVRTGDLYRRDDQGSGFTWAAAIA